VSIGARQRRYNVYQQNVKSKAGFCIYPSAKSHRHENVKEGSGRSDEGMSVVLISLGYTF